MPPAWKFKYTGRILFIGYGSVSRCTMPLIERHFDMPLSRVAVVDGEDRSAEIGPFVAKGVTYVVEPILRKNMAAVLSRFVSRGDLILNLSVEVSSIDVMNWCQKNGVLYLDTCIEPWANYYANPEDPGGAAHQLLPALHGPGEGQEMAEGRHLGAGHPWRQSRPDQPLRQAGAAGDRQAQEAEDRQAAIARGMGQSCQAGRHQGHPCRRARHADRRRAEASRANSSTPGAFPDSAARARSRPELGWGTHEKQLPANGGGATRSGRNARSISTSRAASPRCAPGRPSAAR